MFRFWNFSVSKLFNLLDVTLVSDDTLGDENAEDEGDEKDEEDEEDEEEDEDEDI